MPSQELEREKHAHGLLRFQLAEATAALKQREEMLEVGGICDVAFCWFTKLSPALLRIGGFGRLPTPRGWRQLLS